ncbi:aldo/keto reductase [Saccharibacillus sp. CPCC 101409]|uniref:aldo/keto reductase n=1 Tax=Saccharibacillus sp. CPCC 101409 TaxID=3058041 RepID=UPI002671274F|nr:aldo/keto reductase [Saccharibacillus sp. CPCC 101409]MDO3410059.1 aldo/keto reductase [Saccharibacillus sp. CPCC 101409]
MKYRQLGKSDLRVSEIGFGTWAIGGDWGGSSDEDALEGLRRAMDEGVNFFDTADVYGGGHAENLLAEATKGREDEIHIATKFCRAGDIGDPANYSEEAVRHYCEDSLKRLGRERIDLYQIHCPPTGILRDGAVFGVLDKLKKEGKIRHYGVSVETVEQGLLCLNVPGVSALQIIFNLLRQTPTEELLPQAAEKGVGILVRLPLASGLLTGKFTQASTFAANDHRNFNANGEQFNVGETFAGLPFEKGVELADGLKWIAEGRGDMARASMRWILDQPGVSTIIPGFKNTRQVEDNLGAAQAPGYSEEEIGRLADFYRDRVKPHVRGEI